MYHSFTKAFIAVVQLRTLMFKGFFYGARNEGAAITIIKFPGTLHKDNTLLQCVVLMSDGIMQSLTNGIVVILLHCVGKQGSPWQFTHCFIAYLCQNLVNGQQEGDGEMLIVVNNVFLVLQCPCNLGHSWMNLIKR